MVHRNTMVVALLSTVCAFPVWSQDQSPWDGCSVEPSEVENAPQPRTKVKWVQGPDGKRTAVTVPVREMKVARVVFVGSPALSAPLQEQIAKSLTEHDYDDDQEGLDELLERTRDAWLPYGYFKAESELSGVQTLEENPERRTVAVTVKVDAGKQYRLEEINFRGGASSNPGQSHATSEQFSTAQLRAFFPIKPGEIFDTHKLQAGTEELRKAYGTKGFINFAAVPTFNIDETNNSITLVVDLDEGKQFHIGKVQVLGGDPQRAEALLKEAGLTQGSILDASKWDAGFKLARDGMHVRGVERHLDEQRAIIDLTVDLRDCP